MSEGTHRSFDLETLGKAETYKLLAATVVPRPIAWITTLDAEGRVNAAPFSFFNVVSSDPPLVCIGFSKAPDREGKDTWANVLATAELVVNMVPEELAGAMNITATDAPRGLDELALAGVETAPSDVVKPPRIAGSPMALECRVFQFIQTGGPGAVLLARAVRMHVRRDIFSDEDRLHIDSAQMRLIGRMGGAGDYMRTADTFAIARVAWKDMEKQ